MKTAPSMTNRLQKIRENHTLAHVLPFIVFLLFVELARQLAVDNRFLPWWRQHPEQWVYPLQTVVCLGLLWFFRKSYNLRPVRGLWFGALIGVLVIVVWVVPSVLYHPLGVADWPVPGVWKYFGLTERKEGFDPTIFSGQPFWFGAAVFMRFVRMVVVVAFVEEIFWRGFLMRYIIDRDDFRKVPFGTFKPAAFWLTVILFAAVHLPPDWLAAIFCGAAFNWVAIRTKSLTACVIAHAAANLVLGIYVMLTKEWGFW